MQDQTWIETRWTVGIAQAESFTAFLDQIGCLGSFQEMDLNAEIEGAKSETTVKAYFANKDNLDDFKAHLQNFESDHAKLNNLARIPYGDWATAWKEFFHPFNLTDRIVIRPSWEEYTPKSENEIVVTLDPGMAFGTGQHDTTRFCAELIDELAQKDGTKKSLLDVGCGSGILSILAKRVGFETVVGLDIEGPAIETCEENLERNPETAPITFIHNSGDLNAVAGKHFDVVVANIIAEALVDLKAELLDKVAAGGTLILSGILPTRADMVKEAFASLKLIEERTSNDWVALVYAAISDQ